MKKLDAGKENVKFYDFPSLRTGSALLKTNKKVARKTLKESEEESEMKGKIGGWKEVFSIIAAIVTVSVTAGFYLQKMQSGIENQGKVLNKIANGMEKRDDKVNAIAVKQANHEVFVKLYETELKKRMSK